MAEGWAKHLKSDCIEAFSAGVLPCGLNERAIKVMAEAGVDISEHRSKHLDEFAGIDFDYVVTLCDSARQSCPVFETDAKIIHRAFDDPTWTTGTPEEIMKEFRRVRDEIRVFVESLPENLARQSI